MHYNLKEIVLMYRNISIILLLEKSHLHPAYRLQHIVIQLKKKPILIHMNDHIRTISGDSDFFEGSFRQAIWPFLVVGQLFAVMPIRGVTSHSLTDLKFSGKNIRTYYSCSVTVVLIAYSLILLYTLFTHPMDLELIGMMEKLNSKHQQILLLFDVSR